MYVTTVLVFRQDHDPLQDQAERERVHNPDHRLQRGDSAATQGYLLHCVGCGRTGQDQEALATLLPKHGRSVQMYIYIGYRWGSETYLYINIM